MKSNLDTSQSSCLEFFGPLIRVSRIKFREISSLFLLETDFRFEFLVRKYACAEIFFLCFFSFILCTKNNFKLIFIFLVLVTLKKGVDMADWKRFWKKHFLGNLYKGQNLKVRKFQIHSTLQSKVIKRKPTGGKKGPMLDFFYFFSKFNL